MLMTDLDSASDYSLTSSGKFSRMKARLVFNSQTIFYESFL